MENISIIASLIAATTLGNSGGIAQNKISVDVTNAVQVVQVEKQASEQYSLKKDYIFATDAEIKNCDK